MRVQLELIGLFRQKAGTGRLEVELPVQAPARPPAGRVPFGVAACKAAVRRPPQGPSAASAPSVLQCLLEAEASLGRGALIEEGRLREGVLVFLKDPGGATRRVLKPAEERVALGQSLVLSTAMGGG
jgi:hypothetical protein